MELVAKKYKQTDVGIIPIDWDLKRLLDVSDFSNGKAHEQSIDEVGDFVVVNSKFISTEGEIFKNSNQAISPLAKGDITLVMSDIPNGKALAKCYLIEIDNKYTLNQRICSIKTRVCNNVFLFYVLNRNKYFLSFDSGSGQTNLRRNEVLDCPLAMPPTIAEQTSIATALSNIDELIALTEKLIEKKKAIKQGVMQELLKPKEGWVKTCLFELAEGKKSQFDDGDWIESEFIIENGIRLIQTGNIGIGKFLDKESKKYISEESYNKLNCKEVILGDLLICRLAEPAGRACIMPYIGEQKVITSVDVSIFRASKSAVNRNFLSQIFASQTWFQKVLEKVGGTTHKRISRGALGKIEIELPTLVEQNRITNILFDMDHELDTLANKYKKLKLQKQGMMQALLTGKIRLI